MRLSFAVFAALLISVPAFAQERPIEETEEAGGRSATDEEQLYDQLVRNFQKDYLRFTTLIQVVPTVAFEDTEGNQPGFDVAAAWLGIGGQLDQGVGYFVRGSFDRSPALLEAYASYGSDALRGIAGRQKVPFSAEFLTGAGSIDFVNRSRIVNAVVPGRATGAQLRVTPTNSPVSLRLGAFNATQTETVNGTRVSQSRRGGGVLAARAQSVFDLTAGTVTVGANAAYNTDDTSDQLESPGKLDLGADVRVRVGRLLFAGEYLRSRTELPYVPSGPTGLDGGYVTLGYDVTPDDRVLARLDVIALEDQEASTDLVLGYNRTVSRTAGIQANVVVPVSDANGGYDSSAQALLNLQIAF